MAGVLDWDLVHGAVPIVVAVAGAVAGGCLLIRRERRWWARTVPVLVVASVSATLLIWWVVEGLWRPFPDSLPYRVVAWVGVALFGTGLAVVSLWNSGWRRRLLSVVAGVLVVAAAGLNINAYYGHYPSMRAAFGLPPANEVPFDSLNPLAKSPYRAPIEGWRSPPGMPREGKVTRASIPAPVSKFPATREAYIYVPPAYLTDVRPLLPVLVLLHGQPGAPADWINGGQIAVMMDRYAAAHDGLAPIVVMPDATGSTFANPLCADSRLGASETYLSKDVPDWIRRALQVDVDSRHWAVAGFSYGGTCALQLALRQPQVYPTFVDISGQQEPTLGSRARTVNDAFGGDEAAFRRVNPLDLLATSRFPGSAGVITVGKADREYLPQQRTVFDAARRNGLDVVWHEVPGSHNWQAWSGGLSYSLDWLAGRMGLTR